MNVLKTCLVHTVSHISNHFVLSVSIFSSENPFYVEPPAKAFYHPSRKKHLSKKEKQVRTN